MKCICENCNKEFNTDTFKRFCTLSCSKSYASKNIDHSKLKDAKCIMCGKNIKIKWCADPNKCKCNDCKKKTVNRKCRICGSEFHTVYNKHCPNSNFCNNQGRQIKTLIKYFGFDKSKLGTLKVFDEYNRIRQLLYDDLWKLNLTTGEICEKYNYPYVTNIGKIFKHFNIPTRNLSDAIKLNYLNNRVNIINTFGFKQQWHKTWNNKEVYLHSSYELDYAKQLDEQKIDYDVECLRIKYLNTQTNEYSCAIPDFYLKDSNTIIEIKSLFTLDIQEMKDKFKAYKEQGYNCKLILEHKEVNLYNIEKEIDINSYNKIIRNYQPKYHMIKGTFCWIYKFDGNNIPINKKCAIKDLDIWLNNGWKRGRIMKY